MKTQPILLQALSLSLLCGLGCKPQPEPVKKPRAPDVSEVVTAYDAPTAELSAESAGAVFDNVNALVDQLAELGLQEQLLDTINTTIDEELAEAQKSSSSAPSGQGSGAPLGKQQQPVLEGEAYLVATRICGGFGPEPVADREANGAITLTLGVSDDRLDPVMWGSFEDCKYRLGDSEVLLSGPDDSNGQYAVWVGEGVALQDFKLSTVLFQMSLWSELDGAGQLLELDFWLDVQTLELKFRIPVDSGYVIAQASTTLLGISATNGEFGCNAEQRYCEAGDQRIEF